MTYPLAMQVFNDYKWLFVSLAFLLGGFLLLYWGHLPALEHRWSAEDNSYCYLIPFVFGYLVWLARPQLFLKRCGSVVPGYLVLLLAGAVYLMGLLGSLETLVYGSMWLAIIAGAVLLFGFRALYVLGFSFIVLAFAVPLPPFIIRLLTFRLKLLSSEWAVRILELLSIPAYGEGNVIDMGVTKLQIVDACSGLRYLLPSILLALLIGYFFHSRWWKRIVLVLLSIPVTLVSNAFRIAMTGVLIKYVSVEFGEGFLHDFSGWLVYMISILLLGGISFGLGRVHRSPGVEEAVAGEDGKKDEKSVCPAPVGMNKIWPHALVCGLLLVMFSMAGDYLFNRQVVPERENFKHFTMQIDGWMGKRLYLSQEVLDQLWADDYVTGNFKDAYSGNVLHLLVSYYDRQTTVHTAHAPTSCLVGSGWSLDEKHILPPSPATGRDFSVARMVLRQAGTIVVSNFWFQQRGRHIVDEYKNKMWLVWDSLTLGRSDGALVRLELFLKEGQSVEDGQKQLDAFAGALQARLKPYIPGRNP